MPFYLIQVLQDMEDVKHVLPYHRLLQSHHPVFLLRFQNLFHPSYKQVPYFHQADGNWSDNTDQSGNIADKKIIADTLKEYGSKEDKKTDGNPSKDTVSVDSNNNLNGSTAESGDSQTDVAEQPSDVVTDSENTEAVEQNATESNTESSTEVLASDKKAVESKKTKDKHGDYAVYVIVAVLIICVIAAGVIAKIKNRIMK